MEVLEVSYFPFLFFFSQWDAPTSLPALQRISRTSRIHSPANAPLHRKTSGREGLALLPHNPAFDPNPAPNQEADHT